MSDLTDLKTDCRHFRWDRPCAPHKREGVTCGTCSHHDPIVCRVAIVKLAAVGDVLRTTSFLPAIHETHPGAWITWVTSEAAVELFAGNELVDEVWRADDPRLRVQEFDVVYCPDADPETAALATGISGGRHIGFRMGSSGRVEPTNEAAAHWLHTGVDDHKKKANTETYQTLVARVLDLDPAAVREPILTPSADDAARAASICRDAGLKGPLVGINTGAGSRWERKRWDVAHQRVFVAALADQGISVLLLGGPEEAGTHDTLLPPQGTGSSAARAPVVSAGTHHTYQQFAALIQRCDVLVTGDTLALHAACAQRVPVVALFGPTSVAEIELYGRGEKIAPEGLDCLGCYLPTCDVTPHCQQRITPEVVLASVRRWLKAD